ncbi:MAG: hypothetical protein Tsb0014_28120 [Pleurocapsa sp.]
MYENLEGKTIRDRYYIVRKLSSGGFGTIYLGKISDSSGETFYIVKHFTPDYEDEFQLETASRLFKEEAVSLSKLGEHPQIPQIFDYFESDGNFFLVQEFIDGKNLAEELTEKKSLTEAETIKLLTNILSVLKFVHEHHYIHRDIKPSNLIRNRFDGKIHLIDFGAVKEKINPENITQKDQLTLTVGILSHGYTPPEQFNGRPEFCSDIYALGMVAIQALTGIHPRYFVRDENHELIWRDRLNLNYNYHPNFLNIIDKMIQNNSGRRYQSAAAVLRDLTNLTSNYGLDEKTLISNNNKVDKKQKKVSNFAVNLPKLPSNLKLYPKILTGCGVSAAIILLGFWFMKTLLAVNFISYDNTQLGIKIDHPENWSEQNDSDVFQESVVFISPRENKKDNFQEKVKILIQKSSIPINLSEYTKQSIYQIKNASNKIIEQPQDIDLTQGKGVRIVYEREENGLTIKQQEVWAIKGDQIYNIIYSAESKKYAKFASQVETMIQSFEIIE